MNEIVTYLNFDGNCKQAMEFYAKCLGGELATMPFSEIPGQQHQMEGVKDRIMHARILMKGQPALMASDTMPGMPFHAGNNFSVSVGCESLDEIKKLFAALSEGGAVTMPLGDQFWGAHFGMLKDKFGIQWMLNYDYPKPAR
jgi:PhnB protein